MCIFVWKYIFVHHCVPLCLPLCVCSCVCVCAYVHVCAYVDALCVSCVSVDACERCMCVYVCAHACICGVRVYITASVCAYVHVYRSKIKYDKLRLTSR